MTMSRRASEKRLQSQDDLHESKRCDPTLSVDRDIDATNVCDKKTWMEGLALVEQGFRKLCAQPWLTVAV